MATFPLGVRGRRVLAAALLLVVLVVAAWRHGARGGLDGGTPSTALRVPPIVPAGTSSAGSAGAGGGARRAGPIVVDVVGGVRRPGIVRLREGARVSDAIAHAGGLRHGAERSAVNFAAPVADGQQVVVPRRGAVVGGAGGVAAGGAGVGGAVAGQAPAGPVSLSSATVEQLDALPGVGPVTAGKILAYRREHGAFRSVEELDAIAGIGPARIADLRGLVVP